VIAVLDNYFTFSVNIFAAFIRKAEI